MPANLAEYLNSGHRICPECGEAKSAMDLRPEYAPGTERITRILCVSCYEKLEKQRAWHQQQNRKQAEFALMMDYAAKRAVQPQIGEFAACLVSRFGGVQGAADFLHGQIAIAAANRPGCALVINAMIAVAKIIKAAQEVERACIPVSQMTDDELATALVVAMEQQKHKAVADVAKAMIPEDAAEAAKEGSDAAAA